MTACLKVCGSFFIQKLQNFLNAPRNETKAKTEIRECETETETSMINSIARESKTNRYALLYLLHRLFEIINDE